MRIPLSWLREYVPVQVPTDELAERLALSTLEVDRVLRLGVPDEDGNLGLYRVGLVVEAGKHPNADRLQLCRVDVGEGEPRQIVCGAWNFGPGATVAVALPGAVLPDRRGVAEAEGRGGGSGGVVPARDEGPVRTDPNRGMVLAGGGEGRTAPRRRAAARRGRPARRGDREPARPPVGLRDRPRGRCALRPAARAAARARPRARERRSGRRPDRGLRGLPALRRPALPRRPHRSVADLAEDAAGRRRDAPDLERRRRDQLRHARARQPAARVRPLEALRRPDRRPPRT